MAEPLFGNFNRKKVSPAPQSPFKEKKLARVRFGESIYSPNGVVDYVRGIKPKNDADVLDKVRLRLAPMEVSILSMYPELRVADLSLEHRDFLVSLSILDLVRYIADSTPEEWVETREALWHSLDSYTKPEQGS